MSRNGSGVYSLPVGNPVVSGTTITSAWANSTLTDIATALTGSLAADGQTPATGTLNMGTNRIAGLSDGINATDAASLAQVTSAVAITGGAINGTPVGATTASTGRFTTLEVTTTSTFTGNGSFNGTGALKVPVGTTAQQPTPVTGHIRYNTTNSNFEGYYASGWSSLGSAAGSNTQVQYNNGGVLAGSSNLTFDGTILTVPKIAFVSSNTPSLSNYQGGVITTGTAVNTTSGTSFDFTSIPSWVKRITVMFQGVSTNGSSAILVQLGTSGGVVASGYLGSANALNFTTGFSDGLSGASVARHGTYIIAGLGSNNWCSSVTVGASGATPSNILGGFSISLGGTLDRVRITTENGTDTFDAGSINILYE